MQKHLQLHAQFKKFKITYLENNVLI